MITAYSTNLITALWIAIKAQREVERKAGYTSDSAIVAGWVKVMEALERGENVEIQK